MILDIILVVSLVSGVLCVISVIWSAWRDFNGSDRSTRGGGRKWS